MGFVEYPGDAVRWAWQQVLMHGAESAPRGTPTREVLGAQIEVAYPDRALVSLPGRGLVPALGMFEACQLVGQTSVPEMAERWPGLARFRNSGLFDGAYGLRIHGMLPRVVERLTSDADSRQAVLTIYDTREDLSKRTLDTPCTLSLQFLLRSNLVTCISTMRSNDVWLGLPYDLMQFGALQVAVAQSVGAGVGPLVHNVGSLHAYGHNLEDIQEAMVQRGNPWHALMVWGDDDIGRISRRARMLLAGHRLSGMTMWEKSIRKAFND